MPRYSVLLEATGKELPMLHKQQAENYVIFLQQVNPVGSHGTVIESQMPELEFMRGLIQTLAAMLGKEQNDHEKHMEMMRRDSSLLYGAIDLLKNLGKKHRINQKWRNRAETIIGLHASTQQQPQEQSGEQDEKSDAE
jgi:hypothetical protein